MNFNVIKSAVAKQFANMAKDRLFRTNTTGDALWEAYLSAFPEGTNPIYRKRTEHDCSCCRQFIKTVGNVVAIKGGKLVSIWDIEPTNTPYDAVAEALATAAKAGSVTDVFLHYESAVGTDKNFEQLLNGQQTWDHFYVTLPPSVVLSKQTIPTKMGEYREAYQMLTRALATIHEDAIDTVLDLISQNSIYRGAEYKGLIASFKALKAEADNYIGPRPLFVWTVAARGQSAVTAIRNSVIGTLLTDLTDGAPLERAVASFETKVAPANYKRPTALVTKGMIAAAKEKIQSLGLLSALDRCYATIDDIKIGDILFASSNARRTLVKDVFDDLSAKVADKQKLDKVEEVSIDKFIADVLPTISHMEVLVENRHMGNFVSLVAPADPTANTMFKWNNPFSWSYQGDMADSIKERVKQAGGNVTGELCCRLAWDYTDDLDFHMYEPSKDYHIWYPNVRRLSPNGGMLDVDANGCDGMKPHPVENIFYSSLQTMQNGTYKLQVQNFKRRSGGVGFEVEIEVCGQTHNLVFDKVVGEKQAVGVADLVKTPTGITVKPLLPEAQASKHVWGINTHTFVPVTVMMLSPNFWEDTGSGVGNKHYFFMLDGCRNDGSVRGFFNEFLRPELDQHRKVIEMVGSRMKTEKSERQLSGVGFSSTQRNSLTCRITGSFTRNITITF